MSLPSKTLLVGMDYAFEAQPFVDCAGSSALNLSSMDWTWQAQPFVRNAFGGSGPAINVKTWDGLALTSIKVMHGLALASVKTWDGLP